MQEARASSDSAAQPEPTPEEIPQSQDAAQEEEEIDIDLTDPEVEKAAVKIQASSKGSKLAKPVSLAKSLNRCERKKGQGFIEEAGGSRGEGGGWGGGGEWVGVLIDER